MTYYKEIYDELCYRVECGELTLEEAELINEKAYDKYSTFYEANLSKKEKKEKIKIYKQKEQENEDKKYGGRVINASRKTIEVLDKSHKYLSKLAHNRDDESDKKIATAYKAIRHITKSPENSTIEYKTVKDYTGKKYPEDEDYKKDIDGYYYICTSYPHSKKDKNGKPITFSDKKMTHLTNKKYDGDPKASQYSFGHSSNKGYERTTRLHPKKRIYGFPESDDKLGQYQSYGSTKKTIDTNGKVIYKNAESDEGGFIEIE